MAWENPGPGIKRQIMAYDGQLMMVKVHFEKGAVGKLHEHFHEQCSYIVSGAFEFEIGGVKKVVRAGDATYKQPHVLHGAVCLEEGTLIDIFTPERKDFLE